jgi:hypothetical protein
LPISSVLITPIHNKQEAKYHTPQVGKVGNAIIPRNPQVYLNHKVTYDDYGYNEYQRVHTEISQPQYILQAGRGKPQTAAGDE